MKLTSRDNPKVQRWVKLVRDARVRRKEGRLLIEGPHLVQAAMQAGLQPHAFLVSEKGMADREIAGLVSNPVLLGDRLFAGIVDADNPPGIAAEISIPAGGAPDGDTVFLEGVQDPGNVGAIIRSAAAFGVKSAVLDAACADPWSPKALRAGMGGHFRLAIDTAFDERLRAFTGVLACTVVRGGKPLRDVPARIGWIFGGEGQGVSDAVAGLAKLHVTIPMAPGSESLNVAAAAAICLYATFSRRAGGS
ncbi:MAG TPA: RNA methyltransferase [Burkholderiales bacterium]|nr:RNA methyltransferase [Burkholderiales bacterium]